MKTVFHRLTPGRGFVRASALCLLALAASLLHSREARAQFTTTGTNTTTTNNVGIGTTTPAVKLAINGPGADVYATDAWVENNMHTQGNEPLHQGGRGRMRVGTAWGYVGLYAETSSQGTINDLVFGSSSGVVRVGPGKGIPQSLVVPTGSLGIGTTTPAVSLAINGPGTNVYATDAWVENNMHTQGNETLHQGGRGRMRVGTAWGYVGLYAETSSQGTINDLVFGSSSGVVRVGPGMGIPQTLVVPTGRIGVGTATPNEALDVVGNINVSGNINAKYQDVAEWVPSTQKLSAGTVVTLDPERTNQVLASTSSYDTAVAGVISAQPGISLGEKGEGKVLVATTGRVKVRVDASKAPVKIGDLLVTSDVAGVAMKSEPMMMNGRKFHSPGTIIGKALEPLASGTGEILVLLSLQ